MKYASIISNFKPENIALAAQQPHHPTTMFLTCIDSRVAPEKLFEFVENKALVIRNIAAVVPPYQAAGKSLQANFSFCELKGIKEIILMTHSDCGGAQIAAAYNYNHDQQVVANWVNESGVDVKQVRYDFKKQPDNLLFADFLAQEVGKHSLRNLMHYPAIEKKIMAQSLNVSLVHLDHIKGNLVVYNAENNQFEPMNKKETLAHFCTRINDCFGCSCTARMAANTAQPA